jgi:hemolysin D
MSENAVIPAASPLPPKKRNDEAFSEALLEFQSPSAPYLAAEPLRGARSVSWILTLAVVSFFAAAGVIKIDKVVTGRGKVISEARTIVVQPLDTSIVRKIAVHEGQLVKKGELLAELDPTFAAADLGALRKRVASLSAEVDRLTAEAEGKPYTPSLDTPETRLQAAIFAKRAAEKAFTLQNYQDKINSLETTMARSLAEANYYRQRLAVASDIESMRRELQSLKVGSRLNALAAADTRIEMQRNLALAEDTAEAAKRDMQALIAERDAYLESWRADVLQSLTDQGRALSDAEEDLKKAVLRHQLVDLRAPEDAIVLTVAKVSEGSVLQTGAEFITLVPAAAPLLVEADISGDEIGYVKEGDPVAIKFDTFPYTLYGEAEGRVKVISPDSFTEGDLNDPTRLHALSEAGPNARIFYQTRVSLDAVKLHDVPRGFHLVPGMPVTADIKVGKRTILSYLFGRLAPMLSEGMREP